MLERSFVNKQNKN